MNKISTLLLILLSYTEIASAGYMNELSSNLTVQRDAIVSVVSKAQNDFKDQKKVAIKQLPNYKRIIEPLKKQQSRPSRIKKPPEAMIFVSLGMSDLNLKQILQGAKRYQVPVVIRGLYESSFRKTAERMFNLAKEKNEGGVLINPLWFKQFEIKQVPAVVVNDGKVFDVLYGNVPLRRALSIISEQGEVKGIARSILARGGL